MGQLPVIGAIQLLRDDGVVPEAWGRYVQGVSEVSVTVLGVTGGDDTRPASVSIHVDGVVLRTITYPDSSTIVSKGFPTGTSALPRAGEVVCGATLRDTAGQTVTRTETITVCAYAPPSLLNLRVARCQSDGTLWDKGTCARIDCTPQIASVDGLNSGSCAVAYRLSGEESWTQAGALSADGSLVIAGPFALASAYDVRLTVTDALRETVYDETLPVATTLLVSATPTGDGLAFGMRAERAMALEVAPAWGLYAGGQNLSTRAGLLTLLGVWRELWSGSLAEGGSLTIDALADYRVVIVMVNTTRPMVCVIGEAPDNRVCKIAYVNTTTSQTLHSYDITFSGTTMTYTQAMRLTHYPSGSHGTHYSPDTFITSVIGLL